MWGGYSVGLRKKKGVQESRPENQSKPIGTEKSEKERTSGEGGLNWGVVKKKEGESQPLAKGEKGATKKQDLSCGYQTTRS